MYDQDRRSDPPIFVCFGVSTLGDHSADAPGLRRLLLYWASMPRMSPAGKFARVVLYSAVMASLAGAMMW